MSEFIKGDEGGRTVIWGLGFGSGDNDPVVRAIDRHAKTAGVRLVVPRTNITENGVRVALPLIKQGAILGEAIDAAAALNEPGGVHGIFHSQGGWAAREAVRQQPLRRFGLAHLCSVPLTPPWDRLNAEFRLPTPQEAELAYDLAEPYGGVHLVKADRRPGAIPLTVIPVGYRDGVQADFDPMASVEELSDHVDRLWTVMGADDERVAGDLERERYGLLPHTVSGLTPDRQVTIPGDHFYKGGIQQLAQIVFAGYQADQESAMVAAG